MKAAEADWPDNYRPLIAWWAVFVLMVFQIVSMIDRQVMSVMIPEMRADLGLDDFQISLVQGLAFALFYGIMGLFIGALVDRYSRRAIMFGGIVLWSLAATGSGLARTYGQLFTARVLVGFGEASIAPAGQSLLSSIFPRHRLTTPVACFTVAGVLGISLSYFLGGHLLARFTAAPLGGPLAGLPPWRQVLVATGLPGVAVALLSFTIRRPVRRDAVAASSNDGTWRAFFACMGAHARLFTGLILGSAVMATAIQGTMVWTPTFARRVLHVSAADIGSSMGLAVATGGVVGGIGLGLLIDRRYTRGTRDMALRLFVLFGLIIPPLMASAVALGRLELLFAVITLMMMTMGATYGPTMAAVQMISPPALRGRFAALTVLASNLCGYAVGPMLIGFLTDHVFHDPMKVGWSIILSLLTAGPAASLLVWSAREAFLRRLDA